MIGILVSPCLMSPGILLLEYDSQALQQIYWMNSETSSILPCYCMSIILQVKHGNFP